MSSSILLAKHDVAALGPWHHAQGGGETGKARPVENGMVAVVGFLLLPQAPLLVAQEGTC